MTIPDFEIRVKLSAEQLTSLQPANAQVRATAAELERREEVAGLPARPEPATIYCDVLVDRQILGEIIGDKERERPASAAATISALSAVPR